jgi:hypothetical protein
VHNYPEELSVDKEEKNKTYHVSCISLSLPWVTIHAAGLPLYHGAAEQDVGEGAAGRQDL